MTDTTHPPDVDLTPLARTAGARPARETHRSRLRAWTGAALRDVAYSGAAFAWSIAGFTILVTGVSVTASLLVFVLGAFGWVGFAHVVRWTTWVDRGLAGWQRKERVCAVRRLPVDRGFLPMLRTVSSDPQTWKDLAWLGLTSIVGFTLGLAVTTAAGLVATYVSMPIWYRAVTDPQSEYAVTNFGLFTVDTLGKALAATAIGLALVPVVLILGRWCAATHAGLAVRLLGPSPHPASDDHRSSHA